MDKRDDINRFRRKRAARKFVIKFAVFAAIIVIIAVIAANWSKIIAPFKDAALDVGKGGFPVDLPGSTDYVLDDLGDNFCLLTDTYFYTYNSEGAMIANVQHGLQNPAMTSNSRRALIYDRNGRDMKFYSRSGEVYTNSTEDTIDFAEISNGERCAVVTKSTKYTNCLYVFNGEGKQIFRWASPLYLIDRVEFSDNDNSIFVSVCGAQNGEMEYYIMRFDLDNAEGSIWQTYVGSHIVFSMDYSNRGIFTVAAGGAKLLDPDSGEITAEESFLKSVSEIPGGDIRAVLLKDSGGDEVLTVYDNELQAAAAVSMSEVTRVRCSGNRLYVLADRTLTQFDSSLNEQKSIELDDDYSDMIIIGNSAYLLGYNMVQRVEL